MATKEKPQCIQEFVIKVYKVTVVGTSISPMLFSIFMFKISKFHCLSQKSILYIM